MDSRRGGTKFGLLAIRNTSTAIAADVEVLAPGEIVAHAACPIDLPEHWRNWLGTLQTPELVDANLTIAIQVPSVTPDVMDAETHAIEQRLDRVWHGLRLQGIPDYLTARIALGGINMQGELRSQSHS